MKKFLVGYRFLIPLFFVFIISCNNATESVTSNERSLVRDSVQRMANSIAEDLSHNGPVAWLTYFENSPEFFMAANGQLVFPNIETAKSFINNTLVKIMPKIDLHWSNIQIDPLSNQLAGISAAFHEDIMDSTGKLTPHDGYFTAIAHKTTQGWKLHNVHWSGVVQ